ncbi:hypothetical protein [Thomasclavelia ramosa]|uniref:hypothetical protein n=2 Tax=Bacillota TaxID=1239 RepID=UPI00344CDCDC
MDFSIKQALTVVVVLVAAVAVVATAITMTNDNNSKTKTQNDGLWNKIQENSNAQGSPTKRPAMAFFLL